MLRSLKRHFIPHKGNHHRPHLLRRQATRTIILGAIVFELVLYLALTFNLVATIPFTAAVLPGVLATLTNEQRTDNHLATLTENPLLDEAATLKAQDMAAKGYFAHTSPEGKTPWYWLNTVGYKYQYAGENLAINFSDSIDVTNAWMKSPTHRANIEKAEYTEIGTGIATGIYQGNETIFVAQVFASPASTQTESTSIESQEPRKIATVVKTIPPVEITTPVDTIDTVEISASNTPEVLGAETTPTPVVASTNDQNQKGIPVSDVSWAAFMTSPRHIINTIFFALGALIVVVMTITIIVRIKKKRHPDLIINALIVIAVLLGLFFINSYWTHTVTTPTSSFIELDNTQSN